MTSRLIFRPSPVSKCTAQKVSSGLTDQFELNLADYNSGSSIGIALNLAQNFSANWSCIALTQKNVSEYVCDWMAFGPTEIGMRNCFRCMSQMQKNCCNRIR